MGLLLLDLPHEVLHSICFYVGAQDLHRLSCCQSLRRFIRDDNLLYKELYLNEFVCVPQIW